MLTPFDLNIKIDMKPFQEAMVRFQNSVIAMGKNMRKRRLERAGISMGEAPGPFPGSVDISIPDRTPRL